MMIPLSFLVFIFGTIIGSFLNVVIDRADMKESPVKGHSFCPHCYKTLAWWELIPVLSFFLLKGKCSSCKHKLSWQYPLVETGTGLFFVFLFWRLFRFPLINLSLLQNITFESLFIYLIFFIWLYWISVLIIISVYDLKKYLILNEVLLPAIIFSFFGKIILGFLIQKQSFYFISYLTHFLGDKSFIFGYYSYFISMFFGIIFACGVISFLAWVTKEKAMGWGDAILALFLGIILGWPEVLVALMIAFLSGGSVALVLLFFKKKTMKSYLPFAPFLSFGALTVMFFGDIIIEKYLSLLF